MLQSVLEELKRIRVEYLRQSQYGVDQWTRGYLFGIAEGLRRAQEEIERRTREASAQGR